MAYSKGYASKGSVLAGINSAIKYYNQQARKYARTGQTTPAEICTGSLEICYKLREVISQKG
jgi:hypothetical protein